MLIRWIILTFSLLLITGCTGPAVTTTPGVVSAGDGVIGDLSPPRFGASPQRIDI